MNLIPTHGVEVQGRLDYFADHIHDLLSLGCGVLEDLLSCPGENTQASLPRIGLFRHVLEIVGGLEVLIRGSWTVAAEVENRALLEAALGLEALLKGGDEAAYDYLAWDALQELRFLKSIDPDDPSAENRLKKAAERDQMLKAEWNALAPPNLDVGSRAAVVDAYLGRPHFLEARRRCEDAKKKHKARTNWYTPSSGCTSVEQLARHLERDALYECFYRSMCGAVHADRVHRGILVGSTDGRAEIRTLRSPLRAQDLSRDIGTFSIHACSLMAEHIGTVAQSRLSEWFTREVQEARRVIGGAPLIAEE